MEIVFTDQAWQDLEFWEKSGKKAIIKKIRQLLADIQEHPFEGLDKPEALKYDFSGS